MNYSHGHTVNGKSSKTFQVWHDMIRRCRSKNRKDYCRYGGRGIDVCDRWLKFENFLADMGEKPDGMSIDRKDNNGNYEPGNCRWATSIEQSANKRNNVLLTYLGKTQHVAAWASETGIKHSTIRKRISKGWTIERALTARKNRGDS